MLVWLHCCPLAATMTWKISNATAGKNVITRSYPTDDTQLTAFKAGDRISVGTENRNPEPETLK